MKMTLAMEVGLDPSTNLETSITVFTYFLTALFRATYVSLTA